MLNLCSKLLCSFPFTMNLLVISVFLARIQSTFPFSVLGNETSDNFGLLDGELVLPNYGDEPGHEGTASVGGAPEDALNNTLKEEPSAHTPSVFKTSSHPPVINSTMFTLRLNTTKLTSEPPHSEDLSSVSSPVPQMPTCHQACLKDLEQMRFTRTPSDLSLHEGSSLELECSLPVSEESSVRMLWLFQRVNPPTPQCSLTPQDTLMRCDSFPMVEHFVDSNVTSKSTKEVLVLLELQPANSGYYLCMVEMSCCSNSHTMDKTLETGLVEIYNVNYTTEIWFLLMASVFLFALIGVVAVLQRRRQRRFYSSLKQLEPLVPSEDVLHAPILDTGDDDSFQENDEDR